MCLMKLAYFQVCGHDDWIPCGNPCDLGHDEWLNRCSGDRNIYIHSSPKMLGPSYCSDCYANQIALIRGKFTRQLEAVFADARLRNIPAVAMKRLMEDVEMEMQEKIDEWRATCFREPSKNRHEAKMYLREKVDWYGFVSSRMMKEKFRGRATDEAQKSAAQEREKKLWEEWKAGYHG